MSPGIKDIPEKNSEKKSSFGKWLFIIGFLLFLALGSMIAAGIIGLVAGTSSDSYEIEDGDGNVALIKINGVILTDASTDMWGESTDTGSTEIVESINSAKDNPAIKAVLFEINSPGGSGVAADEIAAAVKGLNKTSVAYVRDLGASAAYWIASSTDYILANRLSFVGSIGVIASYIEISGLLQDYNVTYQRFVSGKYKDFGTMYRKPTQEERNLFQEQLDQVHEIFIQEVALNRNMSVEKIRDIGNGMIFTGVQAKELGLIDEFGGKDEAIKYIENKENITVSIVEYKKEVSLWDLFASAQSSRSYSIGRGIGDSIVKGSAERRIMLE